jgi:hypothetical protein
MSDDPNSLTAGTEPAAPYPVIRGLIRHKRAVTAGGAAVIAALGCWLALRTGFVELYAVALLVGAASYVVLLAAVEVVELVAETLMPR